DGLLRHLAGQRAGGDYRAAGVDAPVLHRQPVPPRVQEPPQPGAPALPRPARGHGPPRAVARIPPRAPCRGSTRSGRAGHIAGVDGGNQGGLARVATLKKQVASPGRTVLMILAGDFLSPSVDSSVFQGKQMVATLNAAGLDIATLGNHEFDFGPDVLRQRMS